MKFLNIVNGVIKFIFGFIFFAFALAMSLLLLNFNDYGLTQFGDTTLVIVSGDVSATNYNKGDLVLVETRKLENLKEGEEIFAYRVDEDGFVNVDIGKVGKVYVEDQAVSFENGNAYASKFIIGTPTKTYEKVGTILSIIESKWGFLFIVLVPCFLIFLYEVYALIVEIKYGAEEE